MIQKEDVLSVAKDLKKSITDKQAEAIVKEYPSACKQSRFNDDTWRYIVEVLIDELED